MTNKVAYLIGQIIANCFIGSIAIGSIALLALAIKFFIGTIS
jgi:hypothetical protein